MKLHTSKNSLIQDILLLSKNWYNPDKEKPANVSEQMRKLGANYCGMDPVFFKYSDAAKLLCSHALPLILEMSNDKTWTVTHLLTERLAPDWISGSTGDYWKKLIESLLSLVCSITVRGPAGENLLPFEIPEVDPEIKKLINSGVSQ